jgi:phage tail-like protein
MAITGLRLDPLPAFNFYITLIDSSSTLGGDSTSRLFGPVAFSPGINLVPAGGFSECSGLEATLQVEEYQEGGQNGYVHKFPTRMTYSNLVLKRGLGFSDELWKWHFDYAVGRGRRRDGLVTLRDQQHAPLKVWQFKRGMPLKWTGPTLNATQSAIAIESLEIVHEGLDLVFSETALAEVVGQAIAAAL